MSRFNRKKRPIETLKLKNKGGLNDLLDNDIKGRWYINDEEFNTLCKKMSDSEMDIFLENRLTFSQKRFLLNMVDRYINLTEYRDDKLTDILKNG